MNDTNATHFNDEKTSADIVALQKKLQLLRGSLLKAKANLAASNRDNVEPEEELYGGGDRLNQLTKARTQTFLKFTILRDALQLAQANRVLTEALGLEKDGGIQLESEEVEYVKGLLDEKGELVNELLEQQDVGVERELELVTARGKLAGLITDMKSLMEQVREARGGTDTWDQETTRFQELVTKGDHKLNQMRFTIQKFILSYPKQFNEFDDTRNKEIQELFLRCGKMPSQLRTDFFDQGEEQEGNLAPAAN